MTLAVVLKWQKEAKKENSGRVSLVKHRNFLYRLNKGELFSSPPYCAMKFY